MVRERDGAKKITDILKLHSENPHNLTSFCVFIKEAVIFGILVMMRSQNQVKCKSQILINVHKCLSTNLNAI